MLLARLPCLLPLSLSILSALPAAQSAPQTPAAPASPEVAGVDVTFLANAGFFLESGSDSVLIDAFLREPTGLYGALPVEAYKPLVNAEPPYDGRTLVLVSHGHPDHLQPRGLEKYLAGNELGQLMTSTQVTRAFKEGARDLPAIVRQLSPVAVVRGTGNRVVQEGITVEFLDLAHAGGKANQELLNLGHLIEMGGLKLLHVGDADPTPENFAPYGLARRGIDVAFVPYWFFGSSEAIQVLREQIHARTVVACHVPATEWDKLDALLKAQIPEAVLFRTCLEKKRFLPPGAEKPAGG
jgi:L-ascorbate metabolism protein UlaG (beta-lactamase superfamily)